MIAMRSWRASGSLRVAASGAGWGALLGCAAAAAMLGHRLFGGHGYRVWLIEAGNDVLNWTIAGAILSAMR